MKKLIATLILATSTQAMALDLPIYTTMLPVVTVVRLYQSAIVTTLSPTITAAATTGAIAQKEILAAANDSAASYLNTDGQSEVDATLAAAFDVIGQYEDTQDLNNIEMAALVLIVNESAQ